MSNKATIRIPKDAIVQVGQDLGLEVNRLASYFGLKEGNGKIDFDKQWEDVLPVLLQPLNFSGITTLFEDDSLLFTNVLSDAVDTVFCGTEAEDLAVLPMHPDAMMDLLASYLGVIGETPRVKQELSSDALIALLAIADTVKRAKLSNVLDPSQTEFEITLQSVSKAYEDAIKAKDLRWLAPFASELRFEAKVIDFNKALMSLAKTGIIQYVNKKIDIDDNGSVLFDELLRRKSMLGIRSVFYHEGVLNYLSLAFLRTENMIWQLDVSNKGNIMSLSVEELKGMIATLLAPGEIPPPLKTNEEVEEPTVLSSPRFCRNCGAKLSEGAKFCKSCGTKIS